MEDTENMMVEPVAILQGTEEAVAFLAEFADQVSNQQQEMIEPVTVLEEGPEEPEMNKTNKRINRGSLIWSYFNRLDDMEYQCKKCHKVIRVGVRNSTSNLNTHLKAVHSDSMLSFNESSDSQRSTDSQRSSDTQRRSPRNIDPAIKVVGNNITLNRTNESNATSNSSSKNISARKFPYTQATRKSKANSNGNKEISKAICLVIQIEQMIKYNQTTNLTKTLTNLKKELEKQEKLKRRWKDLAQLTYASCSSALQSCEIMKKNLEDEEDEIDEDSE